MNNSETTLAIFYNFKEQTSCPFCKMVNQLFDKGGTKLVLERLGVIDAECYEHNFEKCFIHHYWITDVYKEKKQRALHIVIEEAVQVMKMMKTILAIK